MKKVTTILIMLLGCLNANAQLGYWTNYNGFVELTPDESFIYRYVQTMDAESQKAIDELLSGKGETEDKSILRINEGKYFVKNDYSLPEGSYFESAIYKRTTLVVNEEERYVILPRISFSLKSDVPIDGLLEYLGNKVTLEDKTESYARTNYILACQMKTSKEVLETGQQIYEFGLESMKNISPEMFWLNPEQNSYLLRILTGNTQPFVPKNAGEKLVYEMDWAGVPYVVFDAPEGIWEGTAEGLAINNPSMQETVWYRPTGISDGRDILLEKNHDYIVRLTMKVPSDGTLGVILMGGGWYQSVAGQVPVSASDDFQEVDVEFPHYGSDMNVDNDHVAGGFIMIGTGWIVGTTIVKKVQVIENRAATIIQGIKATNFSDNAIYNLAGQKVSSSYKGIVIRNGKKVKN